MELQKQLENMCREVDGCRAVWLMNLDGLLVLRHVEQEGDMDDEILLVEMSSIVRQAAQAIRNVEGGELLEFTTSFDRGTLVIRLLKDDHFIALLLEPPAYAGKGRYVLRRHSPALIQELF